jgi:type I restriction enzyme S subunit
MFGDPVTNPLGWDKLKLESLSQKIIDCPHSTPKWSNKGVICIRTSNLTEGHWDWTDTRYITIDDYKERTSRSEIQTGDIILSREGTVGVAAIVPSNLKLCMGQRLVQVRPKYNFLTSEYLLFVLLWELAPERLNKLMRGSTSKHLNVKDLRALKVTIPPLALQNKFKNIIEQILKNQIKLKQSLEESENLFNSLLQRAFKGEL